MRFVFILLLSIACSATQAQILVFPDSAVARKNKVKSVRIYHLDGSGKSLQKILHYDKRGRMVMERVNEQSYYYTYSYDEAGRVKILRAHRANGALLDKTITEYNDKDSTRTVSVYFENDTLRPQRTSVYDKRNQKIKETYDNGYGRSSTNMWIYDDSGQFTGQYDSSSTTRIAQWYSADYRLVKRRTYDPKGQLLHEYRFTYHPNGQVSTISDSTGIVKTVRYEIKLNERGELSEYRRDQRQMTPQEVGNFRKEYYFIFPEHEAEGGTDMAAPEIENEHHFTYDKKGNIVRDDLVQKMGTFSSTYVYLYEYEFY